MYNDAINRLKKEIESNERVISMIENFDSLELVDKLDAVRNSYLRYQRDEIPDILQEDFKSEVLKDGEAFIDVNELIIECGTYSVEITFYNSLNRMIIRNENRIKDMTFRNLLEIDNSIEDKISRLEKFVDTPNSENYKLILKDLYKNPNILNKTALFFNKKSVLEKAKRFLAGLRSDLNYRKLENEKYYKDLENNKLFKVENEKFVESIKEDIEYFKSRNYDIVYDFENEIF